MTVSALDIPPALVPVLDLAVDCDPPLDVGESGGGFRRVVPITGGSFTGLGEHDIRGEVLPGGADWNLQRPDGVFELAASYLLRTDDGALITIANNAILRFSGTGVISRSVARFEVGAERHRWLTQALIVGQIEARDPFTGVDIRLYRVDSSYE